MTATATQPTRPADMIPPFRIVSVHPGDADTIRVLTPYKSGSRGYCQLHYGRGLRVLQREGIVEGTSLAGASDDALREAILRWTPAPMMARPGTVWLEARANTGECSEVTNADTPAPEAPAPSPEPSGGIFDTMLRSALGLAIDVDNTEVINCVTRLVDANGVLRREMDDSFSAGWRKASGETDALGRELVEAQREIARAHGEIQNLKDDRDDDRERSFQANNAVATAGARLRDVLRKIAGFSDNEVTTPSDEVIIERALAEHRRRNQVDANHLDVLTTLQRPRLLTEDDLERRFAALVESRKLRAIALGEVSDVSA